MNITNLVVVPMKPEYVSSVVQIHLVSFDGFFLTFLGPRFLSLYYLCVCEAPEGIAFVCLNQEGAPAGFVVGSINPRGFYLRLLKQNWLKFVFASVSAIIRKPSIISRIARAVFYPKTNPVGKDVAGLFSIGVLPELQGTGAGKKLVQAFLQNASNCGCKSVILTTDRDNNDSVNTFYLKLGFNLKKQYKTPEGRRMNEYWIEIN